MLERISSLPANLGTDISHCGEVGTGQIVKLMNNMLALADELGVEGEIINCFQRLQTSAYYSAT